MRKSIKRYELVAAALRSNIVSGRLEAGLVLLEGPIASLMKTSRAPVQAALRILEDEKLIRRFGGRGYLVGRSGTSVTPVRRDIGKLGLRIPNEIDAALQNRGLWEVVYEEVESAVAACLIFGEFRIIESELGDYYGVSRTVVRDVLGRLHERGIIAKTSSSHWIVGPLTAESVRERFQVRRLLEPEALRLGCWNGSVPATRPNRVRQTGCSLSEISWNSASFAHRTSISWNSFVIIRCRSRRHPAR
jgi:DNA-binding GntR family transcriptional regulator